MKDQNNHVDRLVKVDVSDSKGNILERWKSPASDRKVGRRIIIRLKEIFGIRTSEIQEEENKLANEDRKIIEECMNQ